MRFYQMVSRSTAYYRVVTTYISVLISQFLYAYFHYVLPAVRDEEDVDAEEEDPALDFGDEASFDPADEVTEEGNDEGRIIKIYLLIMLKI